MAQRPQGAAAEAADVARPRVIYVMGAGRSGSTILGVALGNCADVFYAGELDRWLVRAGVPKRETPELLGFWRRVLERMVVPVGLLGGPSTSLERSSALLDVRRWAMRRRLRPSYRRAAEDLYQAIQQTAGVTHLVDSSHYPMRARELQAVAGIDLYLLYLVREPRRVVASLGREDVRERRFGLLAANAYLLLTQLLSLFVFLRHPRGRRIFVRHEDLLEDPERVLEEILRQCASAAAVPDLTALRTGLPFHGNRLIESDVVSLSRGSKPAPRSLLTDCLQSPLAAVAARLRPAARTR
jgi:Sulfotransferase family